MIAAARDLGASAWRAFRDVTFPLMRGGVVSSFLFSFLLSFNEYARAYFLVGRQNTLPLAMFGAMNSGASPTIYAFSGTILVVSFAAVGLVLFGVARRQSSYRLGSLRGDRGKALDQLSVGSFRGAGPISAAGNR